MTNVYYKCLFKCEYVHNCLKPRDAVHEFITKYNKKDLNNEILRGLGKVLWDNFY